ncbi:MAG: response regulator transcription factor [bacterium]|nr:response regulator transcription factor [bacterium]
MSHTIAVIGSDHTTRTTLKVLFQRQGYRVNEMTLLISLMAAQQRECCDLVLLDLPTLHTTAQKDQVLEWVREWQDIPILVMMAQADAHLAVPLLNAGIDNYLLKPLRRDELLAKVRALLRRQARTGDAGDGLAKKIEIQGLHIDLAGRRAFVDTRDIRLTRKEFYLLAELASHIDAVCTHEELLAKVWGGEYWDANHYLHVYFGRIRKKMGVRYGALIETIPGMGYMLHSNKPLPQPLIARPATLTL